MELTKQCPIQRPVYGIGVMQPAGVRGLAAVNGGGQMEMRVQQFSAAYHEFIPEPDAKDYGWTKFTCKFCLQRGHLEQWEVVLAAADA